MNVSQLLDQVCDIVREDGERILAMRQPQVFTKEGHANFVTSADLASQAFLMEQLSPSFRKPIFLPRSRRKMCWLPGTTG